MTLIMAIDPGLNTGVCLGYYDATTPFRLLERWQVHHGLEGFLRWLDANVDNNLEHVDEVVVEKFVYDPNADNADISGVPIEGVVALWARQIGATVIWNTRFDKGALVGYPNSAKTKAQRQRVRFDFLKEKGVFAAGTENDDSNDAITHAIVSLKARRHMPTLRWISGKE